MSTPLYTIEGLERSIAQAPSQARTGAKFLNIDTRVLEMLIRDSRKLQNFPADATGVSLEGSSNESETPHP